MKQKNNVTWLFTVLLATTMMTLSRAGRAQFITTALTVGDPAGSSSGSVTLSDSGATVSGSTQFLGGATSSTTDYSQIGSYNASVSNFVGGYANLFLANNTSTVNVNSGGNIGGLILNDTSTGMINAGGSVGVVRGLGKSTLNVNSGDLDTIYVDETSVADIYGGTINSLSTEYSGTAIVHGGDLYSIIADASSTIDVYGGNFLELSTYSTSSTINLYGHDLILNSSGFVTGSLQDGHLINAQYEYQNGHLNLINSQPVPEASSAASLGLMLASFAGVLAWESRKRKKAVFFKPSPSYEGCIPTRVQ